MGFKEFPRPLGVYYGGMRHEGKEKMEGVRVYFVLSGNISGV